jgi:predicted transcriptional regulator
MSVKRLLEGLTLEKAPGPTPSFTVFDIMKVLEIIAETGSIGRGKLSEGLGLGGGATRTLLARLKDAELVFTSKSGCSFTEKGRRVWTEIKTVLAQKTEMEKNELTFAAHNVAILVKGRSQKVKKGLEQRDAAVRAGAKGATTLVFEDNRLALPTISQDLAKDHPEAFRQITSLMNLEENDVVIISSADQPKEAEYGALAAAWTIF